MLSAMSRLPASRLVFGLLAAVLTPLTAQDNAATPRNDLPQPYRTTRDWGGLPPSIAQWPAVTAIEAALDGSIYVVQRCHDNSCEGRSEPPILKYNASGTLLKAWGEGLFNFPHGAAVDAEGNLWVTDARGGNGKGHRLIKFDPDGRILMTLGTAGVSGSGPSLFDQPTDVAVAPNGDLFVTDSHRNGSNNRVVHFSKDGRIGSARDGLVTGFIEDMESTRGDHSGAEGVGVDAQGNVYGAVVRRQTLERHVRN